MPTVAVHLARNIGESGLMLLLFDGADAIGSYPLSEVPDTLGRFEANVTDELVAAEKYRAIVTRAGVAIYDGWHLPAIGNAVDEPQGPVDLQPVLEAVQQINGTAIAEDVAGRLSALVLTVQSHTIKASGEIVLVRGDDYSERPIRIEIDTADDLAGLHLVIAALSEHGDRFAVRMPIQGDAPEHYASFCPSGELTGEWPEGQWHLRHRIEYAPGKLSTVARSTMTIQTFATPEEITNLG